MGYYMRFFQTDDSPIMLGEIEAGLREVDVAYTIERDMPDSPIGLLKYQDDLYGEMELNRRGEGLADEEIDEFRERLEARDEDSTGRVLRVLNECRCIVVIRVLFKGFDNLERIDPVWDWLFLHKEGLVQADAEGFYDEGSLILPLN